MCLCMDVVASSSSVLLQSSCIGDKEAEEPVQVSASPPQRSRWSGQHRWEALVETGFLGSELKKNPPCLLDLPGSIWIYQDLPGCV